MLLTPRTWSLDFNVQRPPSAEKISIPMRLIGNPIFLEWPKPGHLPPYRLFFSAKRRNNGVDDMKNSVELIYHLLEPGSGRTD